VAPVVGERPELFILGSSQYGPHFAAVNGMSAVFAHHMSPDLALQALQDYRRDFTARAGGADAYSAMSVLAFASDDDESVLEFARSRAFRGTRRDDNRIVTCYLAVAKGWLRAM